MVNYLAAENSFKNQNVPVEIARQSIPTGDVLHRRNMAKQSVCLICGAQDLWKHSLLECNMARCVWTLTKQETVEHICKIEEQKARAWLTEVISSLPREELLRTMITLWGIWHLRKYFSKSIINTQLCGEVYG